MAYAATKFVCLFLILSLTGQSLATEYIVGDGYNNWNSGVNLNLWLSGKIFHVGDVLVFKYVPLLHAVAIVDLNAYNTCNLSVTLDLYSNLLGLTKVTLKEPGLLHITSNIGSDCILGLKIAIDVQL